MDIDRQDEKALLECLGAVKPRVCSCTEQDVLSKALLKIDSIDFGSLRRVFTFVFTT